MKDRNKDKPGYKKTEAGWIPQEWRCAPAGSLFDIQLGKMLSQQARHGYNPQPYLANYNVRWGVFDLAEVQQMDFYEKEIAKFQLQQGDLLVCEGGEVGRCAVWEEQIKPCYFQKALHRVRPSVTDIDVYFVMYFIHYAAASPMMVFYVGQSSISHFTREQFVKFPIALPPLWEQRKISEIVSTWDSAIDQTRKLITAKNIRKKALMQQLLSGKKRFRQFNNEWKIHRFSDLLKVVSRPVEFDDETLYALISVRRRSEGLFRRETMPGRDIKTKQLYVAKQGDFLLSKMQAIHGATATVTEAFDGCFISGSYISLCVADNADLDICFFNWLSQTPFFYHLIFLSSYGVHIEKMTFNLRFFLNSKIEIPEDIQEQRKIAQILDEANNEIDLLDKKLESLEQQKRGLMQKLLTGAVRVKN